MTLAEVVNCAPFRLAAPRPLTAYEWTVVDGAISTGFTEAGHFSANPVERGRIHALIAAIQQQDRKSVV